MLLDRLDDLARPETPGAHAYPPGPTIYQRTDRIQVWKPSVLGEIMSMTDSMADHGAFSADVAPPCHTVPTPNPA